MNKIKWLDRRISAPGPYLCLCLSDAEFQKALKQMGVVFGGDWIKSHHADATSHHLRGPKGLATIVCMRAPSEHTACEVAGLLVHEAVHAWQEWCDYYGEANPGREQEAYAVQAISQELMAEYSRRVFEGNQ